MIVWGGGGQYVLHNGKRLYFPNDWESHLIQIYYNNLCLEKDKNSPHRYETEEYAVRKGDIIVDIGAAEGIWALDHVEKAEKIYLFECERKWIKTLEKTFEPWKEKVVIVNKYVSNVNDKKNITLDEYFKEKELNFIKADIEGMEIKLLEGSKKILNKGTELKLSLCTYHKDKDAENIKYFLENEGYKTEYSKGYMLFIYDKELEEPYLRRGLIRAKKI